MLGAEPNAHTQGVKGAGSLLPATFLFSPTPSVLRTHELMTFCSLPQTTGEMPGQAGYLWLPGCQVQGGGGEREREAAPAPPEGVVHMPLLLPASWLPLPIVGLQSCSISYSQEGQRERKGSWPPVSTWFSLVGSACGCYLGPSNTWWPKYQGTDNSLLHLEKSGGDLMAGVDQGGTSGSQQQPWAPPSAGPLHTPQPQSQGVGWVWGEEA